MKSIKSKILVIMLSCVVLLCIVLGIASGYLNYSSSVGTLKQSMAEEATIAADRISYELQSYVNIVYETGSVARLSNPDISVKDKQFLIDQKAETYGFTRGNILGADGISIFDGSDYSDRAYYATAMKGKTYITEPLISKVTGKLTIIIAAPLWEKGIPGTTVVGVVYFVPTETFLNDIVSSIKVGAGGGAFILDQTGLNIADKDIKVVTVESVIEKSKENSKLAEEAAIHKLMTAGKTGVDNFKDNKTGTTHIMAYAPINNTNGWSLGIYAVQSEFLGGVTEAIYITLGIALLAIIIATFVAFNFANKITKPIIGCALHMKEIAAGDLSKDVPETNLKDETGMLMEGMASLLSEVRGSIEDVSWHLQEMGEGNFSHDVEREYIGDFAKLKTS
ncbi:MAG: cache domain-containing protein, partial [Lachnospiraceae bacterium]|nr:cache domain-containing protein [Lachnospiraceae bacterium]